MSFCLIRHISVGEFLRLVYENMLYGGICMEKSQLSEEYIEYVRTRITQLRLARGISEYQLSFELGHSRGYINNISSGKSVPSLSEFFYICDYFDIDPSSFFDSNASNPELLSKTIGELRSLEEDDLLLLLTLIKRIKKDRH